MQTKTNSHWMVGRIFAKLRLTTLSFPHIHPLHFYSTITLSAAHRTILGSIWSQKSHFPFSSTAISKKSWQLQEDQSLTLMLMPQTLPSTWNKTISRKMRREQIPLSILLSQPGHLTLVHQRLTCLPVYRSTFQLQMCWKGVKIHRITTPQREALQT